MCQYMYIVQLVFIPDAALKPKVFKWTSPEKPDWVLDGALRRRFHSLVPLCWKVFLTREWAVFYQITMILFVPSLVRKSLSPLSSLSRRASVPLYYISILSVKLWARRLPVGNSLNEATNVTSEPFFGLLSLNTFTSMLHGLPSHRGHLKKRS